MTATQRQLELLALDAHTRGQTFSEFWPGVADAVRELHPWNRAAYRRLRDRLLHLVCTGDGSGQFPVGDQDAPPPWQGDDQSDVSALMGEESTAP